MKNEKKIKKKRLCTFAFKGDSHIFFCLVFVLGS